MSVLTRAYVVQMSLCLIKKPAKVIYAVKAHAVVVTTVMLGGVILLLYKVISGHDIVLQVSPLCSYSWLCSRCDSFCVPQHVCLTTSNLHLDCSSCMLWFASLLAPNPMQNCWLLVLTAYSPAAFAVAR